MFIIIEILFIAWLCSIPWLRFLYYTFSLELTIKLVLFFYLIFLSFTIILTPDFLSKSLLTLTFSMFSYMGILSVHVLKACFLVPSDLLQSTGKLGIL